MPTWIDIDGQVVASTNFTDARGRHFINGFEVPDHAWSEFVTVVAERDRMRAALEQIASDDGWFGKDSGGRQRAAQQALVDPT